MAITSKQRSFLRGLAQNADTIIQIGKGGITESVKESVSDALNARELVKERYSKILCSARERPAISWQRPSAPSRCRS